MLVYPNPTLEYKIYADASGDALGGMLAKTYQVQGKDVDLPIGFTSYTFSKVERHYATITKEVFCNFPLFQKVVHSHRLLPCTYYDGCQVSHAFS